MYKPLECHAGAAFRDVELKEYYATVGLHSPSDFMTFNFGKKPFRYDLEKRILQEKQEVVKSILSQPINHYTIHQIVHSYLLFHGYAKSLDAFEKAAQIDRNDTKLIKKDAFSPASNQMEFKSPDKGAKGLLEKDGDGKNGDNNGGTYL